MLNPNTVAACCLILSVPVAALKGPTMASAQTPVENEAPPAEPEPTHEVAEQGEMKLNWELEAGGRVGSNYGAIGAAGAWLSMDGPLKPGLFAAYSLTDARGAMGLEPRLRYRLARNVDAELALGLHMSSSSDDALYSASVGANLSEFFTLRLTGQRYQPTSSAASNPAQYEVLADASFTGKPGTYASLIGLGGGALLYLAFAVSDRGRHL